MSRIVEAIGLRDLIYFCSAAKEHVTVATYPQLLNDPVKSVELTEAGRAIYIEEKDIHALMNCAAERTQWSDSLPNPSASVSSEFPSPAFNSK